MSERDQDVNDDILDIALQAGAIILQSGGETYRAEETMISVAASLGAESASAFVTPTVVMLTCVDPDGKSHTRIQRISDRSINLGRIARVNELARRLAARTRKACDTSSLCLSRNLRLVESMLGRIAGSPVHRALGVILATAFASFFFSLLFLGSIREASIAFLVGGAMRSVLYLVAPLGLSSFFISVVGGFIITFLSRGVVILGFAASSGNISIAVLMSLVPGLAIVNAIRDIIAGDLVAGSARLMEAFVIAAALSLGAAFGLMLFPAETSLASASVFLTSLAPAFVFAFLATASFAFFFNISRYDILWCSLAGAAGWVAYLSLASITGSQSAAYMTGALCVGILAELFAVIFRKPATVYIVPGIIPLVPGGGMYETMLMAVLGRMDDMAKVGFSALTAAGAIAVGIALASSFARLVSRIRRPVFPRPPG
jgi:uncharacterized membrane protein YjjP (DUF1212 family)